MSHPHNFIDRTGHQYGHLTVTSRGANDKRGLSHWHVVCICGNERLVSSSALKSGTATSCGHAAERRLHGLTTHGMTNHYLYQAWIGVKQRCLNPANKDFENYGQRGISVYEPWRTSFEAFRDYVLAELGERPLGHSLDRIDNDGHYEPGNIRWATPQQQRANQRPYPIHSRKMAA